MMPFCGGTELKMILQLTAAEAARLDKYIADNAEDI